MIINTHCINIINVSSKIHIFTKLKFWSFFDWFFHFPRFASRPRMLHIQISVSRVFMFSFLGLAFACAFVSAAMIALRDCGATPASPFRRSRPASSHSCLAHRHCRIYSHTQIKRINTGMSGTTTTTTACLSWCKRAGQQKA